MQKQSDLTPEEFAVVINSAGSRTTKNAHNANPVLVDNVLSQEIGHRGITVNSIIPFAVDRAGIFANPASYPAMRKSLIDSCPMGRMAEVGDIANAAEFFANDLSSFISGQHLLVNGGANQ